MQQICLKILSGFYLATPARSLFLQYRKPVLWDAFAKAFRKGSLAN